MLFGLRRNGKSVKALSEEFDIEETCLVKNFQKFKVVVEDRQTYKIENIAFPREKIRELIERRVNGEKVRDLAKEIGVKENNLVWFFRRRNVKPRIDESALYLAGKVMTDEQCKDMVELRRLGCTFKEIGKKYSVAQSSIYSFLKRISLDEETVNGVENAELRRRHRVAIEDLANGSKQAITIDGKVFSENKIKEIIAKRQSGMKLQPLADEIGVDRRALQMFFSYENIRPMPPEGSKSVGNKVIPDKMVAEIVQKRMAGESIRSLAKQYELNKDALRRYLSVTGNVPLDSILREVNRTYKINHEFFGEPMVASDDEAYILGLIMTDGYLTKTDKTIGIGLHRNDQYLLEKINKKLGSDRPLYLPKKKGDNRAMLLANSLKMYNDLQRKGIDVSTKSYTANFPDVSIVPEKYQGQFIRGLFDGDGCTSINKEKRAYAWSIVGTKKLVTGVQKVLMDRCNLSQTRIRPNNEFASCFHLSYGGRINVRKIYEFIYGPAFDPENNLCLKRKWEKIKYVYDQEIKNK
ncbi:MAG TPA: LAGLIDADG family homing endonuclease [Candidatus Lokiarchaeia archaeon]|nr:LAGLIDADG family homing endonuclease [Candidatus Lokiarchaeia archaeon]